MLLRQIHVLASEVEADALLVVHWLQQELVHELHDSCAGSIVRLARLEPVTLLQVVSDGDARHHYWPVISLLLEPSNEGCQSGLLILCGALLAADFHQHKNDEVSLTKYLAVRLQI